MKNTFNLLQVVKYVLNVSSTKTNTATNMQKFDDLETLSEKEARIFTEGMISMLEIIEATRELINEIRPIQLSTDLINTKAGVKVVHNSTNQSII